MDEDIRQLATDTAMFLADKLNSIGIDTVVVGQEQAQEALSAHTDDAEFSVADIQRLNYEWNGEQISLKVFAQTFGDLIKQKDRTMDDVNRIAEAYIESVKENPSAFIPQLKAENMSHWRYFILPDGSVYTPQHLMANSPEYETQRGLYEIYSNVLGDRCGDFFDMIGRHGSLSETEREEFDDMEKEVSGSDLMQQTLEVNAAVVNERRNTDVRNLIQYFDNNSDYTPAEKALILKGSMTYSYSEKKKDGGRNEVKLVRITDSNDVAVPVLGGEAASLVDGLRKGLNFKDSLILARNNADDSRTRSVARDFTGWKIYPKSDREEDAVVLQKDAAGTGWCTGGSTSTARSHLSGGDFHIYFENGEPLVAIRTENGRLAEAPRGAHDGQFCTPREEDIAFSYIQEGHGIVGGHEYIEDMQDLRRLNSPDCTWRDVIKIPDRRRYENGEFGGDTGSWGEAAESKIRRIMTDGREERFAAGYYTPQEIAENGIPRDKVIGLLNNKSFKISGNWPNLAYIKGDLICTRNAVLPSIKSIGGNVDVHENASLDASSVESIGGGVYVPKNASLDLPSIKSIGGYVEVYENASLDLSSVESIGRNVAVHENASLDLPSIESIGGGVYIYANANLDASSVESIGGIVEVYENANLDASSVKSIRESVYVYENANLDASSVKSIGGDVKVSENASLDASSVENIRGDVEVSENANLDASYVKNIGGNVKVCKNASLDLSSVKNIRWNVVVSANANLDLPSVESIGKSVIVFEDASLDLPSVESINGNVTVYENANIDASSVESIGEYVEVYNNANLNLPSVKSIEGYVCVHVNASLDVSSVESIGENVCVYKNASLDASSVKSIGGKILKDSTAKVILPEAYDYHLASGVVYGYEYGNTIYLTPEGINPNTPIHEYAHLWAKAMQNTDPERWNAVKETLKNTQIWNAVASDRNYSFLLGNEDRLAGEVLARAVGDRGEELLMNAASSVLGQDIPEDDRVRMTADGLKSMLSGYITRDLFEIEDNAGVTADELTASVLMDLVDARKITIENGLEEADFQIENNLNTNNIMPEEILSRLNDLYEQALSEFREGVDENGEMVILDDRDIAGAAYNMAVTGAVAEGIPAEDVRVWGDRLLSEMSLSPSQKDAAMIGMDFLNERIEAQPAAAVQPAEGQPAQLNIFAGTGENAILSNFAIRPFELRAGKRMITFQSVEQAFQFAKTSFSEKAGTPEVNAIRERILATTDGAELRALGREIPSLRTARWDEDSPNLMKLMMRLSFDANPEAKAALLATGDAVLTHRQDRSRWREVFPQLLTELRAEFMGQAEEQGRDVSQEAPQEAPRPRLTAADAGGFDVYTLGTGKRDREEFYSLIPDDVTMVIDTRHSTYNRYSPHFDISVLPGELEARGMKYLHLPLLSGKTRDPEMMIGGDPAKIDYGKLSATDQFRNELKTLADTVKGGEKVLIISSDSNPAYSARALLLGQILEREENISVGHVNTDRRGNPVVLPQSRIVTKALGKARLSNGDYTQVHFNSDRTFTLDEGVTLIKGPAGEATEARLITDSWNYGNPVSITEDASIADDNAPLLTRQRSALEQNVGYADFTIVLATDKSDRLANVAYRAAGANGIRLTIPQHREDLLDPEFIARTADSISNRLARSLAYRYARSGMPDFDIDSIKLNIAGSNLARVANKYVENGSEQEVNMDGVTQKEGFHVEDITGISQDDLNEFMEGVIRRVNEGEHTFAFEENEVPWRIGEIRTSGQTGIAEAATVAAQSIGISASVLAPKGYALTMDNETRYGQNVEDEAMFKNRFHLGRENKVSIEERIQDIEEREYRRMQGDDGMAVGLTDRQILTLRLCGFSNTDIITMTDVATQGEVSISNAADLTEFIDNCGAGYGIEVSDVINEAFVKAKMEDAARLTEEWKKEGISYITANSPEYPENLRNFKAHAETEYRSVIKTDENGVETTVMEPYQVMYERPAILWYEGNLDLLKRPLMALKGNYTTVEESVAAARAMGDALTAEDISVVADLDEAAPRTAALQQLEHGGHPVVVTDHPLGEPDPEHEYIYEGNPDKKKAPGVDHNTVSKDIADNNGLVMSTNAKGVEKKEDKRYIGGKIGNAIAHTGLFIDKVIPESYLNIAAFGLFASYALVYEGTRGVVTGIRKLEDAHNRRKAERMPKKEAESETIPFTKEGVATLSEECQNNWGKDGESEKEEKTQQTVARTIAPATDIQRKVEVIVYGTDKIALVSSRDVKTRQAMRERYGDGLMFADPKEKKAILERLSNKAILIDGEFVNTFNGYIGTQPLEYEPSVVTLFYDHGKIHNLNEAPDGLLGILPYKARLQTFEAFSKLKKEAQKINAEFMDAVGLDPTRQYRFENADHLVVKPRDIEIRRGDDVRARISLMPNGQVRVFNYPLLSDDMQEHKRFTYNVFSQPSLSLDVAIPQLLQEIRDTLFDRSAAEDQKWALTDRDERAVLQDRQEKGFESVREDNITVAQNDVAKGMHLGLIPTKDSERMDATVAVGHIDRRIAILSAKEESILRSIANVERELAALPDAKSIMETRTRLEKEIDELPHKKEYTEQRRDLTRQLKSLQTETEIADRKLELEEKIHDLRMSRVETYAQIVTMKSFRLDAALADSVLMGKNGDSIVINTGGTAMTFPAKKLTREETEAANRTLEQIRENPDEFRKECNVFVDVIGDIQRKEKADMEIHRNKAYPDEVIADFSNELCIIQRDGKMAYADRQLNIVSDMYDNVQPMGQSCGVATDGNRIALIAPNGQKIFPDLLDGIGKPVDDISLVKKDGQYNLLNLKTGKFVSEQWSRYIGKFSDGLSLIQGRECDGPEAQGKYNFINRKGELLLNSWVDKANNFKDGKTICELNDRTINIDKWGKVLSIENKVSTGIKQKQ